MEDSVVCTSSSTLGTSTPVSEPVLPVLPVAEPVLPVLPVELPVSSSLSLSSSASSDVAGPITLGAAGPLLPTAGPLLFFLALAPPWLLGLAFVKLCTRGNRPRLDFLAVIDTTRTFGSNTGLNKLPSICSKACAWIDDSISLPTLNALTSSLKP